MSWWHTSSGEDRVKSAIKAAAQSGDVYPPVDGYKGDSKITLPSNCSKLSKEQLIDKIKGAIFGNAIGDAVGLCTEFHDKPSSVEKYGPKGPIFLNESIRGWDAGDWTDDTDQMILILDGLLAHGGAVDYVDFAHRLAFWVRHGFPELGDFGGNGCGGVVAGAVYSDIFRKNPHQAAKNHFDKANGRAAANGAVMRTSILGVPHFNDIAKVIANTKQISLTTHYDPRCTASSVACTTAIALMLQGELYDPKKPETIEAVIGKALEYGRAEMKDSAEIKEFNQHCSAKKIEDLDLDEGPKIGYTFKCIGSGIYYLRHSNDFLTAMTELVLEGGDADTNGAVAGALLGCKVGYAQLPKVWLDALKEKDWLMKKTDRLLALLGLIPVGSSSEGGKSGSSSSGSSDVKDSKESKATSTVDAAPASNSNSNNAKPDAATGSQSQSSNSSSSSNAAPPKDKQGPAAMDS